MKSYGRKPTTSQGKKLSLDHLRLQTKVDKKKVADHLKQAKQGIDVAYNKAHAKHHKKDVKERQKYIKKALKLKVKQVKK